MNYILVQNLPDAEICSLIRGPLDSHIILGLERKGINSVRKIWISLRRKLSSSFSPDFRSVGWHKYEQIPCIEPQLKNIMKAFRGHSQSLEEEKFLPEGLGCDGANSNPGNAEVMGDDVGEEEIRQIHADDIHRQKYFLIL